MKKSLIVLVIVTMIVCSAFAWSSDRGKAAGNGKHFLNTNNPDLTTPLNLTTPTPRIPVNGTMPSGGSFQVPPNVTVLPPPPTVSFTLSLNSQNITIPRGGSRSLGLTVNNVDSLNVTFKATLSNSILGRLPSNTTITFGTNTLSAPPNSLNNIVLNIVIGDFATPGTYSLFISAEERAGSWVVGDRVPLGITITS